MRVREASIRPPEFKPTHEADESGLLVGRGVVGDIDIDELAGLDGDDDLMSALHIDAEGFCKLDAKGEFGAHLRHAEG